MPHYGARAEYALHTLLNLSLAPEDTAPSATDLADFQKLPLAFMRKLLTQLEKSGLVFADEGVRGGWQLARPAREVTVLDIVEAAEGKEVLFRCRAIRARCALWPDEAPPRAARTGVCEIHAVMLAAENAMRAELSSQTLAEIADRVRQKSPRYVATDLPAWFSGRFAGRRSTSPDPTRKGHAKGTT